MTSPPGVPAEIENINELWDLVHQKDEDLRHAAELGKMLLDEKEAEAEAHEAEKDALWRRIKDMATRVAELEQESAEAHSLYHDQDARATGEGYDFFGFASPEGISPRSNLSGAVDANLRAKNDVLERKVDIMREQLEETKLELSAVRKAQLYYKRASLQTYGGSSRSPSPTPSSKKPLEHSSAPASSAGVVTLPIVGDTLTFPRTAGVSMKVSPHARLAAEENNHGVNSVPSEEEIDMIYNGKRKEDMEGSEDEIEIPQCKDVANELDASRLLEQNASLMVELDSKDELIEALRQQLKQEQYMAQQQGIRGRCAFSPRHAMEDLGEASSDDDCRDENENPDFGVRERSLMDDLLAEASGNPALVTGPLSIDAPGTDDSENLEEEPWGAGRMQPVAPERRRSFGGVVLENIPSETDKNADWGSRRAQQGNIPPKAGREKSPCRGKKHSSSSPPRRRRRSLDRAGGRGPSPAASSRHDAGSVAGIVGQSLTVAAAPPLDPMTVGALETWPASPHDLPLSWSSAMRALAAVARVGGQQQQQPETFDLKIAELDVTVEGQQALVTPSVEMKEQQRVERAEVPSTRGSVKENVAATKSDVEDTLLRAMGDDKLTPEKRQVSTLLASVKLEAVNKSLMDTQAPPKKNDIVSSGVEQESTPLASLSEGATMEAQGVESDEFPPVVKEQAPTLLEPVKPDTMVIDITRGLDQSPAASTIQEAEGVSEAVRQGLTIDAAPTLAPMLATTAGVLETLPGSPRGVPLLCCDAQVGERQQQQSNFEVEMTELDVAVGRQQAPISLGSVKNENVAMTMREVEEVEVPVTVGEKYPTSVFRSGEGNDSIFPKPARPEAAATGEKEVEDVQPPPSTSEQSAKLEATEDTVVDAQGKALENRLYSAKAVESDDFPTSEKHASMSPDIVEGDQALDVEKDMATLKKGGRLPLEEGRNVQEPAVEDDNFFPANDKELAFLEAGKPKVVIKEETGDSQSPPAGGVDEFSPTEQQTLTSPASVELEASMEEEMGGVPIPAMGDGKFTAVDDQEPTSPELVKPEAAMAKLEDAQQVPAVGDEMLSSASKQEATSKASVMTKAVKGGQEMEDAKAPAAEDKGFPPSAKGQALTSPKSTDLDIMATEEVRGVVKLEGLDNFPSEEGRAPTSPASAREKARNVQVPNVEGRKFSSMEVQGSASPASVVTQSTMKEREMAGIKAHAVTDHGIPTEDLPSSIPPASMKSADKVGGIQRPVAEGQEKPARPSGTEEGQPLATAVDGARDVTRNRAERKSRQAMAKLGLSAVSGVFRVTMKASNGDLLVVEKPDVFRHPQQSTYVIFGEAYVEKSGSGGGSHYPTARSAGAEAFLKRAPAKFAPGEVEVLQHHVHRTWMILFKMPKNPSDPDRATVEDRSALVGSNYPDVLTVMSHTGCDSDTAIEALRKEGGDVVNAVMLLTEV